MVPALVSKAVDAAMSNPLTHFTPPIWSVAPKRAPADCPTREMRYFFEMRRGCGSVVWGTSWVYGYSVATGKGCGPWHYMDYQKKVSPGAPCPIQ